MVFVGLCRCGGLYRQYVALQMGVPLHHHLRRMLGLCLVERVEEYDQGL